jgi:hypothetical protein
MSNTANLVLPYLAVGQAQKHVTVNETLRKLDAIIQLSVVSATTAAEPSTPTDGAVYIIPAGKSGTHWAAFANNSLGYYRDGAWIEITPREGWLAFVKDTDLLLGYSGSAWSMFAPGRIITMSATDKVVGRSSSGAGAAEEIAFTNQARQLCDDTLFSAMRTTLGAGGLADANTWTNLQTFSRAGFPVQLSNTGGAGFLADLRGSNALDGYLFTDTTVFRLKDASQNDRLTVAWASGTLQPGSDNTANIGSGAQRYATVYATTGTINTSDAREKKSLRGLSDPEARAIRRIIGSVGVYRWLASVEAKGEQARLHAGITAQAVAEAFLAEGLDPARYGLFCADPLTETVAMEEADAAPAGMERSAFAARKTETKPVIDENGAPVMRLGVRYDQLFAMALCVLMSEVTTLRA